MKQYMAQFEKYSSLEAYEVAAMAREKGLTLLEGDFGECSTWSNYKPGDNCKGYCVVKVTAGQYLTLRDDGSAIQAYAYDGPFLYRTVRFRLTLEQAKEQIMNFDGTIKNPPNFFAYVRVYSDEPIYYGFLQVLYLEEFARKHGITYREKFVCTGGREDMVPHPEDGTGISDILECCKESFSQMNKDSYLVVSDLSRLNDNTDMWREMFDIIPINYCEMGYTEYYYRESEKLKKRMREYEQGEIDREYENMSQEHREMMLQDDQPCIEMEEEYD